MKLAAESSVQVKLVPRVKLLLLVVNVPADFVKLPFNISVLPVTSSVPPVMPNVLPKVMFPPVLVI